MDTHKSVFIFWDFVVVYFKHLWDEHLNRVIFL